MTISTPDLRVGMRVEDNATAWAEVAAVSDLGDGRYLIRWTLADGTREVTAYEDSCAFTRVDEAQMHLF